MQKIKLICLPYAGGSASFYKDLFKNIDNNIELVLIELPGRGIKFSEALIENINELLDNIVLSIQKVINPNDNYALLGYSMGGILIYELYYKLLKRDFKVPIHMFFCATRVPQLEFNNKNLSDKGIIDKMIELGGTHEEILNNKELMKICVPILRADYKVINTYKFNKNREKMLCNITVINGSDDIETYEKKSLWKEYTYKVCSYKSYKGGHFFINEFYDDISKIISNTILKELLI